MVHDCYLAELGHAFDKLIKLPMKESYDKNAVGCKDCHNSNCARR